MGLMLGATLGAIVVSIGIIRYKTGMILRGDQTLSYVYWAIFTMSVFLAVFRFKRLAPLSFSFRQTIKIGLFAGLLSGLIYTIYIVVLNNYVDTELASKILQFNEQQLNSSDPELSEEAADSLKVMKMSSALRGLVYTVVCMTFGIIHSLVSTTIAKRLSILGQSQ